MIDVGWFDALYDTAWTGNRWYATLGDLAATGQPRGKYANLYFWRPDAENEHDRLRVVSRDGWEPELGKITHQGPMWEQGVLSGRPGGVPGSPGADNGYFELWPYLPAVVNECIDRAMQNLCWTLQQDDVTPDGTSQRYQLGASPFPTSGGPESVSWDILAIQQVWGSGATAQVTRWDTAGRSYVPESDNGLHYIRFFGPATGTLRVIWRKAFAAFADDDTTDQAVDLEYAKWASLNELYRTLNRKAEERNEPNQHWASLMTTAWTNYWNERVRHMTSEWAEDVIVRPEVHQQRVSAPRMGRR